ncbi:MAG: hypothetical protein A3C35_08620 [Omnitrophica bacterium RIFCSPHIGHO2_02_FULL_46_11]|nr:MAG: hypothetical protein A3A81_00685 [Omnitrophica bacterium RIFCSPLOWO2_01_FULL_45_10b]OGW87333.1 MAG: hypothetical protein A3C35_08620 [Omnitrophica bacterium RIFCSPHIGHO2_02_FULL_46_11]
MGKISKPLSKQFKDQLLKLRQEEEVDLYVLGLHYQNDGDLNYFPIEDRRRIKAILHVLVHDTKRHAELLKRIAEYNEK